jgi:hypothetical protein
LALPVTVVALADRIRIIAAAEREHVDPFERADLVDVLDRVGVLDEQHHQEIAVVPMPRAKLSSLITF